MPMTKNGDRRPSTSTRYPYKSCRNRMEAESYRFLDSGEILLLLMKTVILALLRVLPVLLVLASLVKFGGKTTALADNVTGLVVNSVDNKIFPRMVFGSSGTRSVDYPAVPPKGSIEISFQRNESFSLFFATGCSWDNSGHLRNCSSGDCPEGGCTMVDQPVATCIIHEKGAVFTSIPYGYNYGLHAVFQCDGCDCPSMNCVIPLSRCPAELRIYEESGSLVACRAGDGVPSGQDCAPPSSYSPPSSGTTCVFENVILKITVSSPP